MAESLQTDATAGSGHMWLGALLAHRRTDQSAAHVASDTAGRRRRAAATGAGPPLRLAWRVEELVTPKNRLDLAHTLRSLVREADARYLPSASPVNRVAVRAEAETLLAVAARLADLERPVAARGVLLVDRLLVDGFSPLYDREQVGRAAGLPRHGARRTGATLMVELLGIVIAVLCFVGAFALIVLFERV